MQITKDTPVTFLTVGQLQDILGLTQEPQKEKAEKESPKKYVYGLAGIRKLFNISHATAQRYKDTIIADACFQQGRKIIVDVDKALELFSKKK
jgi:hypothetical protein